MLSAGILSIFILIGFDEAHFKQCVDHGLEDFLWGSFDRVVVQHQVCEADKFYGLLGVKT